MKRIDLLIVVMLLVYNVSCQQKSQQQEEPETKSEISESAQADFQKVIPNFPNAAEFAAIIQSTGTEFDPSILADPDLVDSYPEKLEKKSAMLGVYMYDLGYCVAFKRPSYTEEYFDAAHKLAVDLGAEKNFLNILMNRYEENINQNDSVKAYFRDTYERAVQSIGLDADNQEYARTIFISGFYIEGLYNMLKVIDNYPRDELSGEQVGLVLMPVIKAVLNQKENIYNLARMLDERVLRMDRGLFYQNALNQLNETYRLLDVDNLVAENRGEELLNDQTLNLLVDQVEKIRGNLIDPEFVSE